jgi:hypothetical protein
VLINLEEYRFLDGWSLDKKKGSSRCDRIPTELVREILINSPEEYQVLIPEELGAEFTSRDYKKASGLPLGQAQTALNILHYIGVVDRIGKKGHSFLYTRQKDSITVSEHAFEEEPKKSVKSQRKSKTKAEVTIKKESIGKEKKTVTEEFTSNTVTNAKRKTSPKNKIVK